MIDRWAGLSKPSVKSDESSRRKWPMGGVSDTAREICPHILARVADGRGYDAERKSDGPGGKFKMIFNGLHVSLDHYTLFL